MSTCRIELFVDATEHDAMVIIGDIAHIEAASDKGPRANEAKSRKERDDYDNLILLCQNCHVRLDGQKNSNPVEFIQRLKSDHEAWVRNSLPERGRSTTGWAVLLLQGTHPFDLEPTIAALVPDFPSGDPVIIKALAEVDSWDVIHERLAKATSHLLETGDPFDFRLAIFPLAPVSACLGLGYYLTNRPRVRLFQYHRDDDSWSWFDEQTPAEKKLDLTGMPDATDAEVLDVAICFELTARITRECIESTGVGFGSVIRVGVTSPNSGWLRTQSQLKELTRSARFVFERCLGFFPMAQKWHIFYAGPAPGAVAVGQQLNPTMCPSVQFYEFRRDRVPAYHRSFVVGEAQ